MDAFLAAWTAWLIISASFRLRRGDEFNAASNRSRAQRAVFACFWRG